MQLCPSFRKKNNVTTRDWFLAFSASVINSWSGKELFRLLGADSLHKLQEEAQQWHWFSLSHSLSHVCSPHYPSLQYPVLNGPQIIHVFSEVWWTFFPPIKLPGYQVWYKSSPRTLRKIMCLLFFSHHGFLSIISCIPSTGRESFGSQYNHLGNAN